SGRSRSRWCSTAADGWARGCACRCRTAARSPPRSPTPCSSILKVRGKMPDLVLRESPLVRFDLAKRAAEATDATGAAGLVVREHAFRGHINLRGDAKDPHFTGAVGGVMGDGLPIAPNTLTELDGISMYWLGPDEWLIVTPDDRRVAILRQLREVLAKL